MSVYGRSFRLGGGYSYYQVQFAADQVKTLKDNGFFKVNKTFLPVKIFYFLFMGSQVSFLPFVPVYMDQLGLNSIQIGIIRAVQPIGTIVACVFWGTIADKYSIHRLVVLLSIVIGCSSAGATYFTPPVTNYTISNSTTSSVQPPLDWDESWATFTVMLVLSMVYVLFMAHVNPMIDSNVMALLESHPETDYGKQRLWGAIGWGSVSGLTGLAMDLYVRHHPEGNRFLPTYIIFVTMMAPAVFPVVMMKFPPHSEPTSIGSGLLSLFKELKIVVFFLIAIVCGLSLGVIGTFQFLFLNELNAPSIVLGLTLTFTCLSEVPFMYTSDKIIRWFGHEVVFSIVLFCYTLRFFLYSGLHDPWLILPIELLHGICFGALWPAAASFANEVAPEGMGATVQNLVAAASIGLGSGLGTIGGGYIYDYLGARKLFLYCGILCLVTTVGFIAYVTSDYLCKRHRGRHTGYIQIQ